MRPRLLDASCWQELQRGDVNLESHTLSWSRRNVRCDACGAANGQIRRWHCATVVQVREQIASEIEAVAITRRVSTRWLVAKECARIARGDAKHD